MIDFNQPMSTEQGFELVKNAITDILLRVDTLEKKAGVINPFRKELISLPKIGEQYADEIIKIYPTKELLIDAIFNKTKLPFSKAVIKVLQEKYG